MDLEAIARRINPSTARAFVTAARHVVDALLVEAERARQAQPPSAENYGRRTLNRAGPAGGWLSHEELRATAQAMNEAIAVEKWVEGLVFAIRLLSALSGAV